jgi:hypothetical protein
MSYKIETGEIVTIITIVGEYIGELVEHSNNSVVLRKPRMFVQSEQKMGFAPGVCMTGDAEPDFVEFNSYVFLIKTQNEIAKAYKSAVSGIILK